MRKLAIAGLGLALLGVAVAIGAWLTPPATLSYGFKFGLIIFALLSFVAGIVLLVIACIPGGFRQPQLRILFRYDMPWVHHNPGVQDPGHHIAHSGSLFTYRLAVVNHACDLAERVKVEMIWIDPQLVAHRLVPCRLHFRHDNPPPSQPYAPEMDVARTHDPQYRDALFVDVFWFWDAPDTKRLGIWSSVVGVDQEIPVGSYKFAIKVSSTNRGGPITKEFRFVYKTDKAPTIEPEGPDVLS